MIDLIILGILIVLIGSILFFLGKEMKKGTKCIGCPYAKKCNSQCPGKNKNTISF